MGEPYKAHDPEKGGNQDEPGSSLSEGITNVFSKAGEGFTNALSKAGEGILGAGTAVKDAGKKVGEGVQGLVAREVGGQGKKKNYPKKNPTRAKQEKKFNKGFKPIPREEPKDTNIVGNITKLLPANTFLMFQTLAPLSTNDGNCHKPEIFMTSIVLFILASTCMLVCFTDTIQFNGKVYHGLVTWSGLWNPSFKGDPAFIDLRQYEMKLAQFYADRKRYKADKGEAKRNGWDQPPRPVEPVKPTGPHIMGSTYSSGNSQYELKFTDFLHAVLSAMAFCTLTMLTSPVSTCFYPNIPSTVVKTLPLLVGFVISAIFAFSPPARNGIAHPLSPKVPSQMDHYKPPDPQGVVHGPQLPPKPPGKGDAAKAADRKHNDDDDDNDGSLTGSAKKLFGKLFGDRDDNSPSEHHGTMDTVKRLTQGFLNEYGDDLRDGAAKVAHNLGDGMKKEASQLLRRAGSGVAQHSKEFHVPLAQIQEVAKSPQAEALMACLASAAGAGHPAQQLAAAAQSAYAQGAKDAVFQIHQDIQTATSAPLVGLSKQSSMALTRANSMLNSAGSSLSLPSAHDAHDALFHQAAQVLQHSGLASAAPRGSEAASIALAAGQALMQAGLLPGAQSEQAHALNAFAQGMGNLNLNAGNALIKDAASLAQQGGRSWTDVQEELARQQSAFTQGLDAELQTLYNPATSVAQGFIHNGSQTLNQIQDQVAAFSQGTLTTSLASAVARETGTLLQEGADHGITGVQAELARQKAGLVQRVDMQVQSSITQPVSSLTQDVTSLAHQGSQAMSNVKADLIKQKEALTQEMNSQVRALSTPATSVAHDIAALRTTASQGLLTQVRDEASQKLVKEVNSQFVESLARGMARGMSMRMQTMAPVQEHISSVVQNAYHPAASVAIDVASLIPNQSLSQGLDAAQVQALSILQKQSSGQFNHPLQTAQQVVETHLRRLASIPPSQLSTAASATINTLVESAPAQQMAESSRRLRDTTGLVIEEVTDAARSIPQASQIRTEIVASTSEAAGQALANANARIWRERPESTEITDSITIEEFTSESETEGRSTPSSLQVKKP